MLVLTPLLGAAVRMVPSAAAETFPTVQNTHGSDVRWSVMPVEYEVDTTETAGLDVGDTMWAIVSASATWEAVAGAEITLPFRGELRPNSEANTVAFVTDWEHDAVLVALTGVWSAASGEALGFDLSVNAEHHAWATDGDPERLDLQSAVTHEFGHALGIGHVLDDPSATMSPGDSLGQTGKRELEAIDAEIAATFYAAGSTVSPTEQTFFGCSTVPRGGTGGGTSGGAGAALLLLLTGVALRARNSDRGAACSR